MANLTPSAVIKQIESGTPDPIYLVQGEDEIEKSALAARFADLVDEGLQAFNVERVHAADLTTGDRLADGVASLIAAARTLPMMAPRRVVTVLQAETLLMPKRESEAATRALDQFEAFIKQPEPQTVVVLVAFTFTTLVDEPATALALVVIVALSIVLDQWWKRTRDSRQTQLTGPVS